MVEGTGRRRRLTVLPPAPLGWCLRALWESGSGGVLDGATSLLLAGLTGYRHDVVDVSVPHGNRVRRLPGVAVRRLRRMPPLGASSPR